MAPTVVALVATAAAFAAGVLMGWVRWRSQLFSARLTREEALSLVQVDLERDLATMRQEITGLEAELAAEERAVHDPGGSGRAGHVRASRRG